MQNVQKEGAGKVTVEEEEEEEVEAEIDTRVYRPAAMEPIAAPQIHKLT